MNKKGQAAMEFLMTYGWAILVVLAAIAALAYFGVLSPSRLLPERTVFASPIPNLDAALVQSAEYNVEIAFRNNVGTQININGSKMTSDQDCVINTTSLQISKDGLGFDDFNADGETINNGEAFNIHYNCEDSAPFAGTRFKSTLTFYYKNMETNIERPHTGTIDGRVI